MWPPSAATLSEIVLMLSPIQNRQWKLRAAIAAALVAVSAWRIMIHRAAAEPTRRDSEVSVVKPASEDVVVISQKINADFIRTSAPELQTVAQSLPVAGKLSLDRQRLRIAAARVAGRLGRVFVIEGQSVRAGDPLAEIYSPDYLSAEKELLLAERFDAALKQDADAELRADAQATARAAASKLKVLGASDADIARLRRKGSVEEYLQIRAPISGVVIQRTVDAGAYLNIGDTLMTLAQLDPLWLQINLYESDYPLLKPGLSLSFETSALPGQRFSGKVGFIAPAFDATTHTLLIRCDIPNRDGRLRPEMPVKGSLTVANRQAWVVPQTAVVHIGDADYVLVRESEQRFRRKQVHGFASSPTDFAITDGLDTGTSIVTDGGVLLNQALGG